MPAEARIAPIWKKQKLFVSLLMIGFGLYFYFDGAIGWPRSNERFIKHEEFEKVNNQEGWVTYANERGWTTEPPHKLHTHEDLVAQFAFGSLFVVLGGVILVYWLTQIRCVLKTDEEAVYTAAKTRVPFGAITGVGKKKWDTKGIATVRYEMDGRKGEFIVDDYKFETEPARKILGEIEERLLAKTNGK